MLKTGLHYMNDCAVVSVVVLPGSGWFSPNTKPTIQYNIIKWSSAQFTKTWPTVHYNVSDSVNIWDNSYEEKPQLNKCDFRTCLKAG